MPIVLSKEAHEAALASVLRYFEEQMEVSIGHLAADGLLRYVLEEIGPSIYNQAVADVQQRLQQRVLELDVDVHADEFPYWRRQARSHKPRR
jgi:uncharacterized protein (DUF2164 family)